jgi:hypothetical protein
MQRKTSRILVLAALLLLVLGAVTAQADIYLKQTMHTNSYKAMGKTIPEKDSVTELWIGAQQTRTDQGEESSMIILLDQELIYFIDHQKLSYAEMPLDMSKELEGQDPAAAKLFKGLMGGMSAAVTETAETKKIGKWNCRKYLIEMSMPMGKSNAEAWATTDIKIDYEKYYTASNAMLATQPGFAKVLEEMKKIKGVIVYQVSTAKAMGADVTTTTEVLECVEKKAPAGTYDLPDGYKKAKQK